MESVLQEICKSRDGIFSIYRHTVFSDDIEIINVYCANGKLIEPVFEPNINMNIAFGYSVLILLIFLFFLFFLKKKEVKEGGEELNKPLLEEV